jgi:DNA (cytosine-5)-methyltransferase 1
MKVREIAKMGYDCRWCVISAASIGALHRRDRWFLLAHAKHDGAFACQRRESARESIASREQYESEESIWKAERASCLSGDVADSTSQSANGYPKREEEEHSLPSQSGNDGYTDSIASEQTDSGTEPQQEGEEARRRFARFYWPYESREHWQEAVRTVCRTSDGVQGQVDRLKGLGNAVVPQQCRAAFEYLIGVMK